MDAGATTDLIRQSLMMVLLLGAPVLLAGLAVGLVVSVLQAATQVQDQTLSFVPKILAMLLVLAATAPWILQRLVEFARAMFGSMP
jgi:flagellar biosynthetic protein FliQ